jgi:hypothetical protein
MVNAGAVQALLWAERATNQLRATRFEKCRA